MQFAMNILHGSVEVSAYEIIERVAAKERETGIKSEVAQCHMGSLQTDYGLTLRNDINLI